VLVYSLTAGNVLSDYIPDYVLGQPDFTTAVYANTQSGLNSQRGLAFDSARNYLFVAEASGNRVKVFDLSGGITNGMNASYVIGQADFTTATAANSISGLNSPHAVHFDPVRSYLYVAERSGHRVKIFDVTDIANGEDAIAVIGQSSFTTATAAHSQTGMHTPTDVVVDDTGNIVFVNEFGGHRVKTYDVSTLASTTQSATHVIGQADFTTATGANSQSGLNAPHGIFYDNTNDRLFVAEWTGNRVKIFDLSGGITDGMNASNVLGQSTFTDATIGNITQPGLYRPVGAYFNNSTNDLYVVEWETHRVKIFDLAVISDGENAVDLIGQYDDSSLTAPSVAYDKYGAQNSPNKLGFNAPSDAEMDTTNHRLFVSDAGNNRVLVYSLSASNALTDYVPDYVIGQPNFATSTAANSQSGLNVPRGLAFDSARNWLFVGEATGSRVKIFDLSGGITNGMNASYVIGQADFTTATAANSIAGLNAPWGIHFDSVNKYLYVAERSGHRVKIFDVTDVVNGEDAIAVLGQSAFTTATIAHTQTGMREPMDVDVDDTGNIVYVAEFTGHRVKTYDISTLASTTQSATHVLGQTLFTTATAANTQAGLNAPIGVRYDDDSERLFVAEYSSNKVKIYDLSAGITDGMDASNVLGQADFVTTTAANTQAGVNGMHAIYLNDSLDTLYAVEGVANRVKIFDVSSASEAAASGGGNAYARSLRNIIFSTVIAPDPNSLVSSGSSSVSIPQVTATSSATTSVSITTPQTNVAPSTFQFNKNLFYGLVDNDVIQLQRFLNSRGFIVTKSGNGSPGQEISTFGPATRAALAAFQKANSISPSIGYFGPLTRAVVNTMLSVR
jgi:6-phosphogluconolactonase (cycloisomerase 2 family)